MPRPRSEDILAVGGSDVDDLESESCGNFYSILLCPVVGDTVKANAVMRKD